MLITSKRTPTPGVFYEKDKVVIQHVEPIGELLSQNAELRKDPNQGWDKKKEMKLEARFDPVTWLEICRLHPEIRSGDRELRQKTLRKVLNDPNFAFFRTSTTRA